MPNHKVTCYAHFDDANNLWRIEDASVPFVFNQTQPDPLQRYRPLRDGDIVRLVHASSGLALNR